MIGPTPSFVVDQWEPVECDKCIDLRDYIAVAAMQALITRAKHHFEDEPLDVSEKAYRYADAMLKAKEAK